MKFKNTQDLLREYKQRLRNTKFDLERALALKVSEDIVENINLEINYLEKRIEGILNSEVDFK
jgi:hypothetical protein